MAALDVVVILVVSLLAEAAHFSPKQGRAIISGDSAQHVDGAEALLSDDKTANFGFRKPGYTLILAGLGILTGNMSWSAVVANYSLLALVPLAAYGLGCNLRSRLTGWIAAVLTIAQLQTALWGGRIMSEASYTCIMTFGVLLLAGSLSRLGTGREAVSDCDADGSDGKASCRKHKPRIHREPDGGAWSPGRVGIWLFGAGLFLGCAWLIRAIGIAVIAAAVLCILWSLRRTPRRTLGACACLLLPVIAAVSVECGLNLVTSGRFRTSTGGLGIMLQTRARYLQGSPFPDTDTSQWFVRLLPERTEQDAYLANKLDGCVARYRAIHDQGLDEWTFNSMAMKSGIETLTHDPKSFFKVGTGIFVRHLLRQSGGPRIGQVPRERRKPIIVHEAAPDFQTSQDYWYAYWFLPHRSIEESTTLVERMRAASAQRAPFGRTGFWQVIRYFAGLPVVVDVLNVIRQIGSLWPGFALVLCAVLGLNRRTCALLALAYVFEATIIAVCGATDVANERYQFVWIGTDAALVGCLVAPALEAVYASVIGARRAPLAPSTASTATSSRPLGEPITT